jgi:hypothetical protein
VKYSENGLRQVRYTSKCHRFPLTPQPLSPEYQGEGSSI